MKRKFKIYFRLLFNFFPFFLDKFEEEVAHSETQNDDSSASNSENLNRATLNESIESISTGLNNTGNIMVQRQFIEPQFHTWQITNEMFSYDSSDDDELTEESTFDESSSNSLCDGNFFKICSYLIVNCRR